MSKTKFTKGPWVARGSTPSRVYGMQRPDKEVIIAATGSILENSGPNAHLIAAAPEMYEALELLSSMSSEDAKLYLENSSDLVDLLAKARGEQ